MEVEQTASHHVSQCPNLVSDRPRTKRVARVLTGSIPVKCKTINPGHNNKTLSNPTIPKNSGILTLSSFPTLLFITVTYSPYIIALKKAIASPSAICPRVLCGKLPRFPSSFPDPERSTVEMRMTPASDANTPTSFRTVKPSTPTAEQNTSVHTLLVDVRIVTLATLVYSRHADAK